MRTLETYRIPPEIMRDPAVAGRIPERIYPLFRDRDELPGAAELGTKIEEALRASRFLIVLCSPSAAGSTWVNREIATFKRLGRASQVLALIVAGEPHSPDATRECFPPALRFRVDESGEITSEPVEPLAADARPEGDGKTDAALKLIAGVLGVGFDTLKKRDAERRIRRLRAVIAGLALVLGVISALAVYANNRRVVANERARIATSRQLAAQSQLLARENRLELPLLLAAQGYAIAPTLSARSSLYAALSENPTLVSVRRLVPAELSEVQALSPDASHLALALPDGQIQVWDRAITDSFILHLVVTDSAPTALAFSPDAQRLVVGYSNGLVAVAEVQTRQLLAPAWKAHEAPCTEVVFHPRDEVIATASSELGEISLWEYRHARRIGARITDHDDGVVQMVGAMAFDASGERLASTGFNCFVHDVRTGQKRFDGFWKMATSVAFGAAGTRLVIGAVDLVLVDLATSQATEIPLEVDVKIVESLAIDAAESVVAVSTRSGIRLWDLAEGRWRPERLKTPGRGAARLAFSADRTLVGLLWDGTVAVWDLERIGPVATRILAAKEVMDFASDPSSDRIAVLDAKGALELLDGATRQPVANALRGRALGGPIAFDPTGQGALVAGTSGGVALVSYATGEILREFASAPTRLEQFAISPDGRLLVAVGASPYCVAWEMARGGAPVRQLDEETEGVRAAAFDRAGNRLAMVGDSGRIVVWNPKTWEPIPSAMVHARGAAAIAFSRDDRLLATGGYDGAVRLWDGESPGRSLGVLEGHDNYLRTLAFPPDGTSLVSGGDDGRVVLWDLPTRQFIARFFHGTTVTSGDGTATQPRAVRHLATLGNTKRLVADGPLSGLVLWDFDSDSWARAARSIAGRPLSQAEWELYVGASLPYAPAGVGAASAGPRPPAAGAR